MTPRKRVKSEVGAETVLSAGSSLLATKRVGVADGISGCAGDPKES